RKINVADLFSKLAPGSSNILGSNIIGVANINANPAANADQATLAHDTSITIDVLANDKDADVGQSLRVIAINGAAIGTAAINVANGTVLLTPEGKLFFKPTAGYFGDTTFQYTASDGNGGTATATVTLHVTPPPAHNDGAAPITITGTALEGQTLTAVL